MGAAARAAEQLPGLVVFPNPAQGRVAVQGVGPGRVLTSLYDLTGRLLVPATALPASQQLTLPVALPAGIYLLHVSTPQGQRVVRLATQ